MLSAHDVAGEIRREYPYVGEIRLHALLYFCQGHHLAHFDKPLFGEDLIAVADGPVVREVLEKPRDGCPRSGLGSGELGTIGYVLSRYGSLTGKDLSVLTRGEPAWQQAAPGGVLKHDVMAGYVRGNMSLPDEEHHFDPEVVREWLKDVAPPQGPGTPDDLGRLVAKYGQERYAHVQ